MALTDTDLIFDELKRSGMDDRNLDKVRQALSLVCGHRVYIAARHAKPVDPRLTAARKLLNDGRTKSEAVEILQQRFSISHMTAYRLIWRAHGTTHTP